MKLEIGKWTDKKRLDALQSLLGRYTGKVVCRWSGTGRGWRLHECEPELNGHQDVRDAIDAFLNGQVLERINKEPA